MAIIVATAVPSFANQPCKRVAPGPGYVYRTYRPGEVKPTSFLAEFAKRQAEGTLSHRHEAEYPFDQEMWAQAITNLHYARARRSPRT